jgi:hypothetical protein
VVTKCSADDDFRKTQKTQQRRIRNWLTRRGHAELSRNTEVDVFDLRKFAQMLEKLYGVDIALTYRGAPIRSEGGLIGLV